MTNSVIKSTINRFKEITNSGRFVLLDISPSPGVVGLIVSNLITDSIKAVKIADIYSPHFPQVSIINNEGVAMLPHVEIYEVPAQDGRGHPLLIITRNFLVDSNEAGEEVSQIIYEQFCGKNVSEALFITSGRITGTSDIYASSTEINHVRSFLNIGAKLAPNLESLPIDKLSSSLLLKLYISGVPVSLLISDSISYMPDLSAAKKLINLLSKYLKLTIDLSRLDEEIEKQKGIFEELERALREEYVEKGGRPPSYIG